MDQRIHYTTTHDGVRIAFAVAGHGPPVVYIGHLGMTHLAVDVRNTPFREWFEAIAARFTLIRYDHRGTGLSDRKTTDFGMDARIADLDAVLTSTGTRSAALIGRGWGCFPAVVHAAAKPDCVSRLVLIDPEISGLQSIQSPQRRLLNEMIDQDWEMYTEVAASLSFGWASDPAGRASAAAMIRESLNPTEWKAILAAAASFEVEDLLGKITVPVLLLYHTGARLVSPDSWR
jgi:pimeloyl-ACP methyl ester carboxylesterase